MPQPYPSFYDPSIVALEQRVEGLEKALDALITIVEHQKHELRILQDHVINMDDHIGYSASIHPSKKGV